jgi:hypothetical protein
VTRILRFFQVLGYGRLLAVAHFPAIYKRGLLEGSVSTMDLSTIDHTEFLEDFDDLIAEVHALRWETRCLRVVLTMGLPFSALEHPPFDPMRTVGKGGVYESYRSVDLMSSQFVSFQSHFYDFIFYSLSFPGPHYLMYVSPVCSHDVC